MATFMIEKNLMVPMRAGVRLATDVYRLEDSAPRPVLVTLKAIAVSNFQSDRVMDLIFHNQVVLAMKVFIR